LVIESLVAILLLITIGYCTLLNRRLTLLKADEQSLRGTIAELVTATEIAERAIQGLKLTVRECDQNLSGQLQSGAELSENLAKQLTVGNEIVARLTKVALAAICSPQLRLSLNAERPLVSLHETSRSRYPSYPGPDGRDRLSGGAEGLRPVAGRRIRS
jgi:hypothetical protein